MNYLRTYNTLSQYSQHLSELIFPTVTKLLNEYPDSDIKFLQKREYKNEYFTIEALESCTITLSIPAAIDTGYIEDIVYSINNGSGTITMNTNRDLTINIGTLNAGDKAYIRINAKSFCTNACSYSSTFSMTGRCKIYGNIMSLLYGEDFRKKYTFPNSNYTSNFARLFYGCSNIIDAENLILPATTLSECCYREMFYDCSLLETAPKLPAKTLATRCYRSMFAACSSLINAPKILPATTLADQCYYSMFAECGNLEIAPLLPALSLTESCYESMFDNCSSLIYLKALFFAENSSNFAYWLNGIETTGTLVINVNNPIDFEGNNLIPSTWTIEYEEL